VPRKPRALQKPRPPSLARPTPGATLPPFDWRGGPPDAANGLKGTPTATGFGAADVEMDDEVFDLTSEAPLHGEEEAEDLWMTRLDGEAKGNRPSVPGHDDLMRQYLSEMGTFDRLTPAEEVALAKKIEQGRADKSRKPSNRKAPGLRQTHEAADEQGRLWTERLDPDAARTHMIRANLRLVVSIAKTFAGRGLALLDLIQEGNLGLMKAVDRFDWRRGCRFGTYASWWIKQSIRRAISDQGRIIRLPAHITDSISRVHHMRQVWMQMYEEEPTADELSKVARVSEERLAQIDQLTAPPASLDWLLPDGERTVGDQVPDGAYLPCLEIFLDRERNRLLHRSLSELTPRERHVLRLHFGIGERRAHTLEEIGRKFHLTRERIRQIELKALKKLRHSDRHGSLEEFATSASHAGNIRVQRGNFH
jgi:RNA polymerase primary sigma factor